MKKTLLAPFPPQQTAREDATLEFETFVLEEAIKQLQSLTTSLGSGCNKEDAAAGSVSSATDSKRRCNA